MFNHMKKALTFGKFISSVYDACGRQKAEGMVRLAVNVRCLSFEDIIALRF